MNLIASQIIAVTLKAIAIITVVIAAVIALKVAIITAARVKTAVSKHPTESPITAEINNNLNHLAATKVVLTSILAVLIHRSSLSEPKFSRM